MVKFASILRSFDKFGESPKLLYKGQDQYKTKVGGLISLGLTIFVMVFSIMKMIRLSEKSYPDISINESFTDLSRNLTEHNLERLSYNIWPMIKLKNS